MNKPRPSHFVNALQAAAAKGKPRAKAAEEPAQPAAPNAMRESVSKAIAAYSYDGAAKRLRIRFRGGSTFEYDDVPPHVGVEFERTNSHGSLFSSAIRGKYKGRKV